MTKEEIKAIIAQKIEGQGTNLDAASVLPTILNWIIDNIGDNPLADSVIEVGELHGGQLKEISEELTRKIVDKGLFLKSGDSYLPRTSDYLVDKQEIANIVQDLGDEEITNLNIRCCFGYVDWNCNNPSEIASMTIIIVISYDTPETNKNGLTYYEI